MRVEETALRCTRSGVRVAGYLLQTELQSDRQVHRHGLAIERCGLILPLTQGIHCGLMKQRWAGNNFHRRDAATGIDQRVNAHVAGNVLRFRKGRINRRDTADQL